MLPQKVQIMIFFLKRGIMTLTVNISGVGEKLKHSDLLSACSCELFDTIKYESYRWVVNILFSNQTQF